jgi:chaperonin GroEL (HSP60 family)
MLQGTQILVLKEGTERTRDKSATSNNIAAARAIADAVRSTLGPRGMDKMLVDSMGDITITNDGVTILKEVDVEHPAAKMLVEVAKTQDQQCGDGTTTAVVIAGELLKRSESLLEQNVHPTVITRGFQLAVQEARRLLDAEIGIPVKADDEAVLIDCAMTAMGSKGVGGSREELAKIAVRAVQRIADHQGGKIVCDVDQIKVEKRHGGQISDTELIDGIVLDKERGHPRMPGEVVNAKIALLNSALEVKKTEIESKINIKNPAQIQSFLDEEDKTFRQMADAIKSGRTSSSARRGSTMSSSITWRSKGSTPSSRSRSRTCRSSPAPRAARSSPESRSSPRRTSVWPRRSTSAGSATTR